MGFDIIEINLVLILFLVTFLGLSCLSTVLEILMDMFPSIRRLATMGMTSLSFSISITLTLSIIGELIL